MKFSWLRSRCLYIGIVLVQTRFFSSKIREKSMKRSEASLSHPYETEASTRGDVLCGQITSRGFSSSRSFIGPRWNNCKYADGTCIQRNSRGLESTSIPANFHFSLLRYLGFASHVHVSATHEYPSSCCLPFCLRLIRV